MATDRALADINIPLGISRKLGELEIRSVRQLYSRMRHEDKILRDYLQLSKNDFSELRNKIENLIREEYPEDVPSRINPQVNKTGVAVHRLTDPERPKYDRRGKD